MGDGIAESAIIEEINRNQVLEEARRAKELKQKYKWQKPEPKDEFEIKNTEVRKFQKRKKRTAEKSFSRMTNRT